MAWSRSDFHDLVEAIAQPMLRRVLLGLFLLLTAVLVYSATQLRVDAGFSKMVPLEHEYMRTFTEYQKTFGGANRVLVALRVKGAAGDIYTPEFMRAPAGPRRTIAWISSNGSPRNTGSLSTARGYVLAGAPGRRPGTTPHRGQPGAAGREKHSRYPRSAGAPQNP